MTTTQQPQPTQRPNTEPLRPPTSKRPNASATPFLLKLLQFLLMAAGGMLLVANIEPYIAATRLIFPAGGDVCGELGRLPFVGGVLAGGCGVVAGVTYSLSGFVVWGIFQLFELLPIVNNFHVPFLSALLARLQNALRIPEDETDLPSVRAVKAKINSVVERSLSTLLTWSWISYGLDLWLMSWLYSPLDSVNSLNPMLLARVLLGVFGVELVILALTLINNVVDPASIRHQSADKKPVREY